MTNPSTDYGILQVSPEFQDLADALMAEINPELMSTVMPDLDRLYVNETPDQRAERLAGYVRDVATFNERLKVLIDEWQGDLEKYKDDVVAKQQQRGEAQDRAHLQDVERSLKNS